MAYSNLTFASICSFSLVDALDVAFQIAYQLRVELTFIIAFVFFCATNQCLKRSSSGKDVKQSKLRCSAAGTRLPASARSSPQHKRELRDGVEGDAAKQGTASQKEHQVSQKELQVLLDEMPGPTRLRDAAWLSPRLVQLSQAHAQRAIVIFRAALEAGLDLRQADSAIREQLLVALVAALIRLGFMDETVNLLRDFKKHDVPVSASLHVSAVKLSTAKHHFKDCLTVHDVFCERFASKPTDPNLWSCLLFCASEARVYHRCSTFFDQLKQNGTPTEKDYWNMIRVCSAGYDWKTTVQLIQCMREQSIQITNVIYNTALATCVSAHQMDPARALLDEMNGVEGVTDVITYNTIIKGYAKRGDMDECCQLYDLMREQGIQPSQVTYGILLDGCINSKQVDRAAKVFDCMTEAGCPMNTVLYTTLIKGLAREGKVDEAMRIYEQMGEEKGILPDVITYSILLKANCDADRMDTSLELLGAMVKIGLQPDEVIFNNLLAGCAKQANLELAQRLYNDMVASGITPSNATFSILIRLYAQCKALDEAVDMLRTEPQRHTVEVEPRLYSQLMQCCIRARQGRRAVEVYGMMVKQSTPSAAMHSTMLSMCVKLNMLDTAVELLELAATQRCRVDASDANAVLEAAFKKRKHACVESCSRAMTSLGMAVERMVKAA